MAGGRGAAHDSVPLRKMVRARDITDLARKRLARLLDAAEAALPQDQFRAFRRIALREFGDDEFAVEVERLLHATDGRERNG